MRLTLLFGFVCALLLPRILPHLRSVYQLVLASCIIGLSLGAATSYMVSIGRHGAQILMYGRLKYFKQTINMDLF